MSQHDGPIDVGELRVDPERYEVTYAGERLTLTLMQFNILKALARRPGWVQTPEQIAETLPRRDVGLTPVSLKNHIYHLRRRLGPAGGYVRTVRGLGYTLDPADNSRPDTPKIH